jgi:hypothetical protein
MSDAKKLSYKWEKQRRGLATFILRWGERDSDYVYVRGGYWIDDVPRKNICLSTISLPTEVS